VLAQKLVNERKKNVIGNVRVEGEEGLLSSDEAGSLR